MKKIKGPALFLAQFAGDAVPFEPWASIARWAADIGYEGVQVPSWDGRLMNLKRAAASKDYRDKFAGAARQGAEFVKDHIIRLTEKAIDDFAAGGTDGAVNRRLLEI